MSISNKQQLIKKYFNQTQKLTIKNKKYLGQLKVLTNFLLQEDLDKGGDVTTNLLIKNNKIVTAIILSKQIGVIAGLEEVSWLSRQNNLKFITKLKDGQTIKNKQVIAEVTGKIKDILKLERTVLNILQRMSGIATTTNKFIKKTKNKVLICPTRKTQWGLLDKKAVVCGNGGTHRLGLYDFILIKENHIKQNKLSNYQINKLSKFFWEIEVENIQQSLEMVKLNPNAIMFDNFKSAQIKQAILKIKKINPNIIFEASGGINEKNIKQYSNTGVDIISIGSLTHSSPALDISLLI